MKGKEKKNQNVKIGLYGNLQVADSIFPLKQLENKPHCLSLDYMEKDFWENYERAPNSDKQRRKVLTLLPPFPYSSSQRLSQQDPFYLVINSLF